MIQKHHRPVANLPKKVESVVESIHSKFDMGYDRLPKNSKFLIRLAGFSGLTAILMSAYGAHVFKKRLRESVSNPNQIVDYELKELYDTAQYFHLVHSVALLGLPMVKRPLVVSVKINELSYK